MLDAMVQSGTTGVLGQSRESVTLAMLDALVQSRESVTLAMLDALVQSHESVTLARLGASTMVGR